MEFDRERRASFDGAAADYERYRPGYPEEAFRDLVALSRVTPESRLLDRKRQLSYQTASPLVPDTRALLQQALRG